MCYARENFGELPAAAYNFESAFINFDEENLSKLCRQVFNLSLSAPICLKMMCEMSYGAARKQVKTCIRMKPYSAKTSPLSTIC
jgi:hypothetical protein